MIKNEKEWSKGELKSSYNSLLKDIDFDRLDLGLKKPNIFEILNISNAEIRHSNFLAWLLDAEGSHGLGDIFIKRFLREIFYDNKVMGVSQFEIEQLDLSQAEIRREWRNIDLLIIVDDIVICIENKFLSKEHTNQLTRYKEIIESEFKGRRNIFAYLTPFGESSFSEIDVYSFISYEMIVDILTRILSVYDDTINDSVYNYINDYITILKRNIMSSDELTELAKQIYRNHKDLLDFIFDKKPDIAEDFKKYFVEKINASGWILGSENKGYIRFLTPKIKGLVPIYSKPNGWPNKEGFLFEIDYLWSNRSLIFKTVISPGNENYASALNNVFMGIDGHIKPKGKLWLVHFSHKESFKLEELHQKTDDEIMKVLDDIWPKIEDIVSKVEKAMCDNNEVILNAKKNCE
ncbi:MAG: PD-(D/E)XK nuclease family protein [Bacteroidales bacterium]|nr:PD-(D/E)XK nuclease family protein [Bacteroidales bacterium]